MKSCIFFSYIGIILLLEDETVGYPLDTTTLKNDGGKPMVYLNITVYHSGNGNYTFTIDSIPIDVITIKTVEQNNLRQLETESNLPTPTPPPGGLLGSIESFIKVIPAFPGAVIETTGNLAVFLPELLGINVTQIYTSTLEGIKTQPLKTAVTALSNVAFCNPIIAGINYGRCSGFFMIRQ